MFDYHVHSNFSPDAFMSMEEAIGKAIEKGVTELCFTDHIDYDYPDTDFKFEFDYKIYLDKISHLQNKYKGKIRIKKGIEIGLQPHILDRYNNDMNKYNLDFVIASIHVVDGKDLYAGDFFVNKGQKEAYRLYFEELYSMLDAYNNFDVLGHLDIIKRYGNYHKPLDFEDYRSSLVPILEKIITMDKGLEVNTSGPRYKLKDYHPSLEIVNLYHDLGGKIITLGSDAHQTQHVAFDFKKAISALKDIGFSYICTYRQRQPLFNRIDKLL